MHCGLAFVRACKFGIILRAVQLFRQLMFKALVVEKNECELECLSLRNSLVAIDFGFVQVQHRHCCVQFGGCNGV